MLSLFQRTPLQKNQHAIESKLIQSALILYNDKDTQKFFCSVTLTSLAKSYPILFLIFL